MIPYVLTIRQDLRYWPADCPTLVPPETVPNIDQETGDEYEEMYHGFIIDDGDSFLQFLCEKDDVAFQLRAREGWSFLQVALGFLTNAFFAEGVEQLLWHVVTIEALLG